MKIKRAYAAPSPDDGFRILVDRMWPRGVSKENAHVDLWLKDISPTADLRKWFHHDPEKWDQFVERYRAELDANSPAVDQLRAKVAAENVTILFAAKDEIHNNAVVLRDYLAQ